MKWKEKHPKVEEEAGAFKRELKREKERQTLAEREKRGKGVWMRWSARHYKEGKTRSSNRGILLVLILNLNIPLLYSLTFIYTPLCCRYSGGLRAGRGRERGRGRGSDPGGGRGVGPPAGPYSVGRLERTGDFLPAGLHHRAR